MVNRSVTTCCGPVTGLLTLSDRVLRDDPSKSGMHNREGLTIMMIWKCIKDWRMWPLYILGLTFLGTYRRDDLLRSR